MSTHVGLLPCGDETSALPSGSTAGLQHGKHGKSNLPLKQAASYGGTGSGLGRVPLLSPQAFFSQVEPCPLGT